jgi:hypothetical protein
MKITTRKLLIIISLVISMLIFGFSFGQRIVLVAEEDIQVASLPDGDVLLGHINVGQSVEVIECEDLKHYIVPKVRLPDGAEGYILQWKFHLIRHSAWRFGAGPLSFSCP